MRILTYLANETVPKVALWINDRVYDLANAVTLALETEDIPGDGNLANAQAPDMYTLMAMGSRGLNELAAVEKCLSRLFDAGDARAVELSRQPQDIRWAIPVLDPPVVYGIGGNSPLYYRDKNFQIPAYPRGFLRPTNSHALIGHLETVTIPEQYPTMRASAEMGVVIGKSGYNVTEEEAMDYVFGYTLVNDMCSDSWKVLALDGRDESEMHTDLTVFIQRAATSYYSRSTDTFCAIGPYIVTKEEVPDPYNLLVWNRLSGVLQERGYTQSMVNSIPRTVSFLSRRFTLQPGMIFHMGTMGVDGYRVESDMPLGTNDYFEIEYEGIGALRNYIKDLRRPTK